MLYRLRQRSSDEGGFTLIELLVVILIIGILAAIAIPSFLNQKGKANDAAAKSQVKTLQTAIETYATDHNGSYAIPAGEGTSTGSTTTAPIASSDSTGYGPLEGTLADTSASKWS